MKRYLIMFVFALLLLNTTSLMAQEATPQATPEPAAETTPEAADTTMSALFASLPQSRTADGGFVVGQPDAPITIIQFADYACPHCQVYRPTIDRVLKQYLPTGQIKFELRLFPTAGGQLTYFVGQLVECAEKQRPGTFWQSYDLLYGYATAGKYDQNIAKRLAHALDVDDGKLLTCAQNAKQIANDILLGEELGVTGTPAIMVRYADGVPHFIRLGNRIYSAGGVPLDVLEQIIIAANNGEMTPEPIDGTLI